MNFDPNDLVTCGERPGVGRVLRVRRGAGLVKVQWSHNTVSWHDDETLRWASVTEICGGVPAKSTRTLNERGPFSEAIALKASRISADAETCESLLGGQARGQGDYART